MATKPVAQPRPPAVIVNNSDDEMELNVGNFDLVTRSEKCTRLGKFDVIVPVRLRRHSAIALIRP